MVVQEFTTYSCDHTMFIEKTHSMPSINMVRIDAAVGLHLVRRLSVLIFIKLEVSAFSF